MEAITTITFFRYTRPWTRIWAFGMMQFAHPGLSRTPGLQFYKLMGSGKPEFNPWPDWSVYALVQVWENETAADDFFSRHDLMDRYKKKAREYWTLYMRTVKTKGEWDGKSPFPPVQTPSPHINYLAIITRATIKSKHLLRFWKYVPASQKGLRGNKGLIYTKGIGEVPFRNMATFSLWANKEALYAFAYSSKEHKQAISMTHELQWYKEELFARFQPYRSEGQWQGVPPLKFTPGN